MNALEPEIAMRIDRAKTRLNKINKQLQSLDAEALEEEKTLFDT